MEISGSPEAQEPPLWPKVWEAFSDVFEAADVSEEELEAMDEDELLGAVYTAGLEAGLDEVEIVERFAEAGITEESDTEE